MKKYDLSKIMTKANSLRRVYGMSRSESLTKAWGMAKLDKVERELFLLEMKDRWNDTDRRMSSDLRQDISRLKAEIYPELILEYPKYREDQIAHAEKELAKIRSMPDPTDGWLHRMEQLEQLLAERDAVDRYSSIDVNAYDAA